MHLAARLLFSDAQSAQSAFAANRGARTLACRVARKQTTYPQIGFVPPKTNSPCPARSPIFPCTKCTNRKPVAQPLPATALRFFSPIPITNKRLTPKLASFRQKTTHRALPGRLFFPVHKVHKAPTARRSTASPNLRHKSDTFFIFWTSLRRFLGPQLTISAAATMGGRHAVRPVSSRQKSHRSLPSHGKSAPAPASSRPELKSAPSAPRNL